MVVDKYNISFWYEKSLNKGTLRPTMTRCVIEDANVESPKIYGIGVSHCSPNDMVNKAKGRKIALTYALDEAKFDRETRTKIWKKYFEVSK